MWIKVDMSHQKSVNTTIKMFLNKETSVNIIVKTLGGGCSAQADAARHGISKSIELLLMSNSELS